MCTFHQLQTWNFIIGIQYCLFVSFACVLQQACVLAQYTIRMVVFASSYECVCVYVRSRAIQNRLIIKCIFAEQFPVFMYECWYYSCVHLFIYLYFFLLFLLLCSLGFCLNKNARLPRSTFAACVPQSATIRSKFHARHEHINTHRVCVCLHFGWIFLFLFFFFFFFSFTHALNFSYIVYFCQFNLHIAISSMFVKLIHCSSSFDSYVCFRSSLKWFSIRINVYIWYEAKSDNRDAYF